MISSVNNKYVKYWCKLRNIKHIKEEKLYIVETEHLVEEALKSGVVKELIMLEGVNVQADVKKHYVDKKVLKKISLLDSVPNIMAVCKCTEEEDYKEKIVILDNVSDPGNVGTIIRNAVAFGIDTVILSEDSVNKYNDKLIRATQGMFFKINIITCNLRNIIPKLKNNDIKIIGTALNSFKELKQMDKTNKYAIVFGNEGSGISEEIEILCDELIYINMDPLCESLNVASASAIILHYMEN